MNTVTAISPVSADTPGQTPSYQDRRRSRQAPKPASALKQSLTWLCLVAALGLLLIAGEMLLAGLASYRTGLALQRWVNVGQAPTEQTWQTTLAAAKMANRFYPVNSGTYHDQQGQVQAWRAFSLGPSEPQSVQAQHAALEAYRQAILARPTWPNTWARLAHSKYLLGQFDNEFAYALEQANQLGPYRPQVQFELANIGLRAWLNLTSKQRSSALSSIRKTLSSSNADATRLFAVAQSTGLEKMLCDRAAYDLDGIRKLCKRGGNL
ncbi:hypothetical protein ACIGCM_09815 [Pseudomonas sp. NPDC078700]|uniref:hypothetical protein n=1 Tax=Pseudomonas sp. NPDC078700 TaxID=3364424 RepID=UPI0037C93317